MPRDSDEWLKLWETCILSLDLFENWEKLYASIAMMLLFTHVQHDDDEVKSRTISVQYYDNVDKIENSSKKQDRQNDINEMKDFLKIL